MKVNATLFHSSIVRQNQLIPGIHGLRGIAALMVVLYHTAHIAKLAPPPNWHFITQHFGYGVHLFFVLSAYSLLHSTEPTLHRPSWLKEYFIKRLFRIAPLFYLVLACMISWRGLQQSTLGESVAALLLSLSFTFGLAPWTGLYVWAGWSVGVEVLFYGLFPLLLLTVRTSRNTLIFASLCIIIALASRTTLHTHFAHTTSVYVYNWAYFSFAPNFCYFVLGMYAFRLGQTSQTKMLRWSLILFASVLLLTLLASGDDGGVRPDLVSGPRLDLVLWGWGFAALTLWQARWPSFWCANRFFEHIGERSYSVYLLHPIIISLLASPLQSLYQLLAPSIGAYAFFACATVTLMPLLMLSEASYRLVELPGIQFGRKICVRIREPAATIQPWQEEKT